MHILTVLALIVIVPVAAAAQTAHVGARAEGMGGAFVAVADDASAVYWNPAGIATGATFDFQLSGSPDTIFAAAALPVLGLGYYRLETALPTVSTAPGRHNEGSESVPIRVLTTTNVGATFVQTVVPGLVIGTTVRLVRGGIEEGAVRSLVDFDAGAIASAGSLRIGLAGRNLRQPGFDADLRQGAGRQGVEPVVLKRQFRLGAALAPRSLPAGVHGPWSVAVDVELTELPDVFGDRRMAAVGGEYWFMAGRVGARTGFRWNTVADTYHAVSAGITARTPWSLFVDAHLTEPSGARKRDWSIAARFTF